MSQAENILFVGRTEELDQLLACAQDAFSGKPQIVFVTGEAGIGKTYLIERFFQILKAEKPDIVIASGQCTIESASYLPFQSILEDLLESKKQIKVTGEKLRHVVDVVVDTIWDVGPDMIGVFGVPIKGVQTLVDKLGLRGKKSFPDTAIPKDLSQVQIFGWYTKIMKDISAQFPLVLFLDDLHWSDDSSLNLLFHFGRELSGQRILVIGTYRPHDVAPHALLMQVKTKLGRYGAKEISLDLSEDRQSDPDKLRKFVHEYLMTKYQTHFSDDFERFLADRTEGNALFLSEMLKNMEENGQIATDPAAAAPAWRLSRHVARIEDLPERIESVLNERINRLEHSLRDILDCASVEGDEFTAQVLMKVRQLDEWELIDELTEKLMHIHQLITEGREKALPGGEYVDEFVFKHNLIREHVYAQLPRAKKRRIHANISECLEERI